MSFIRWYYPFFLATVVTLYWNLSLRYRQILVLIASYIFYGWWDVRFLSLVLASTIIDYLSISSVDGKRIPRRQAFSLIPIPFLWYLGSSLLQKSGSFQLFSLAAAATILFAIAYEKLAHLSEDRRRRAFVVLSICSNLTILGFFKYFNFFTAQFELLLNNIGVSSHWNFLAIILPVGLSFYTFQSISYAIDVYQRKIGACTDFIIFATYVAFFPQLVAGPIERGSQLLPQLQTKRKFNPTYIHQGLRLFLIGLFKKIFIADNCALLADYAFDPKTPLNAPWALLGVTAFAFQIYGDFSGYTDMARGSAKFFGIDLVRNFRFPYFAATPSDFWRRWHISLSMWFRDYVYIPLGGNRGTHYQTLRNLMVTMFLAGLWHGASWNFVLWGIYYGFLLILFQITPGLSWIEKNYAQPHAWKERTIGRILMIFLTCIGWVIFRSKNIVQIQNWFVALTRWPRELPVEWRGPFFWLLLHSVPLLLLQFLTWKQQDESHLENVPWFPRGLVYTLLLLLIASSVTWDQDFIYFQF